METEQVRSWLAEAARAIEGVDAAAVADTIDALARVSSGGGTIFLAGNGGNASTASHLALDLQKAARVNGRGTRAIALSDSAGLLTAWANDESFERVFAEQLRVLAQTGDALIVLSVSGESPNIVAALSVARQRGLVSVAVTGRNCGAVCDLADHVVAVPSNDYGWVESAQVVLAHVMTYALRDLPLASAPTRAASTLGG